tara:strand:+ start:2583 stop:2975 length:393 start_codon:yes stop_codon:yes gene_type:complete
MNVITIYKKDSGVIIRTVSSTDDILNNVLADEDYIEGSFSTDEYIIKEGKATKKNKTTITKQNKTQAQIDLRQKRDSLLINSDWTQTIDSPLSDTKKQEWQFYRQELRDLPATYKDIESIDEVIFPKEPE